jgi:hypothetical protein
MPESRNTFIKSKMNKDLDSRIVPNGEYRNAENVSISRSEGSDVGALENTLGNVEVTNFGLSAECKAEIIGKILDPANNRIFVLITNYTDNSSDQLSNPAYNYSDQSNSLGDAICHIGVYNIDQATSSLIVSGSFLNFSTSHHVTGINIIEDLLFWTDNRNQPRKINIKNAIINSSYYTTEDQISVAKIYPWENISFLDKSTTGTTGGNTYLSNMKDVVSPYLPGFPKVTNCTVTSGGSGYKPNLSGAMSTVIPVPGSSVTGSGLVLLIDTNPSGTITAATVLQPGSGYKNGDIVNPNQNPQVGGVVDGIKILGRDHGGSGYETNSGNVTGGVDLIANLPTKDNFSLGSGGATTIVQVYLTSGSVENIDLIKDGGANKRVGDVLRLDPQLTPTGTLKSPDSYGLAKVTSVTDSAVPAVITLSAAEVANPDLDSNYSGDDEFIKDKFVKFSYRFKFDDGEYSLMAPFSQTAFVPEQDGFFISSDEDVAYKSTELRFMRNKINRINMNIPSPLPIFKNQSISGTFGDNASWKNVFELFKIVEVDILFKDAISSTVKIVETISSSDFANIDSRYLPYSYEGNKPYKTLSSKEIVRVSDIVPLRALSQEVVGNRIVYGSYLDKGTEPQSIAYDAGVEYKSSQVVESATGENAYLNTDYRKEYQNHTLKQNRTYQAGLILCDRYGRQSNVILSTFDTNPTSSFSGSTVYNPYKNFNFNNNQSNLGGWFGDSLYLDFQELIPGSISEENYQGLFYNSGSSNSGSQQNYRKSTGWYSVKFVVKQNQQDYYNCYLPGLLKGVPDANAVKASSNNPYIYSVLQSDNINKIPRSLRSVGPEQQIFSTSKPKSFESDLEYIKRQIINAGLEGFNLAALDEDSLQDAKIKALLQERDRLEARISLADKDNSAVEMFLRVNNNFRISKQGVSTQRVLGNISSQYWPQSNLGVLSPPDQVVLIGKATDLGLYSITPDGTNTTSTVTSPEVASVNFLDSTSNPLVMKIESNGFGFINQGSYSSGGVVFKEYLSRFSPGAKATTLNNTADSEMKPQLAVYETSPVESELDIYWETSGSIPVSQLNSLILASSTPSPNPDFSITTNPTNANKAQPRMLSSVSEASSPPINDVVGTFQVLDQNLNPATITSIQLSSVFLAGSSIGAGVQGGGNGINVTSDWVLSGTNPSLTLKTTNFMYTATRFGNFTFFFTIVDSNGLQGPARFTAFIPNVAPTINFPTAGSNFNIQGAAGGVVLAANGVNGTADPARNTDNLFWFITQADASGNPVNYFNLVQRGNPGSISINSQVLTQAQANKGPFSINLRVFDRPVWSTFFQLQDAVNFTITVT